MLKGYRKRFVCFNMLLVGVVLLAALVVQGFYLYRSRYAELETTMRLIVAPWDSPGEKFRALDEDPRSPDGMAPPEGMTPPEEGTPPEKPLGDVRLPERDRPGNGSAQNDGIMTVFYSRETDEISVLSLDTALTAEELEAAVREILTLPDSFGRLDGSGLIYYREETLSGSKLALAERSYLLSGMLRTCSVLLLAYVVSMGLVFLISLRLSRLAARPMEEAIERERQFVADLSHDLKTPITVVLANNSILRSNPTADAAERAQWLDSTDDAARDMMRLVSEMLTLSSLESPGQKPALVPLSLSSAAEKAALQLESLAWERHVTVETALAENVTILAAPGYAERICSGLLENALKYEPDGGRVQVSLTSARKKAVFTVKNFGSVIPPDDQAHLFERFYRGDKARTGRTGYGLGLPIIKQITDLLGAEIRVHSSVEEGTSFTVIFDLCEHELPAK